MLCETIENITRPLDNPNNDLTVVLNKAMDIFTKYYFEFRAFGQIVRMNWWSVFIGGIMLAFILRAIYGLYDAKFGGGD